eukprot:COSAG01_NODE_29740_length_630_cov_2.666667_1_plen_71_part_01
MSLGPGRHLGPRPFSGIGSMAHMLPAGCVPSVTNVPGMGLRLPSAIRIACLVVTKSRLRPDAAACVGQTVH